MKVINLAKEILPAVGTNKVSVIKVPNNREIRVSELQLIIRVSSIAELAYYEQQAFLDEEQKNAMFWQNANTAPKKGVIVWFKKDGVEINLLNFLLFNRQPYYIENLLERYTGRNELLLEGGTEILISMQDMGYGLLSGSDRLTLWGTYMLSDAFYE